MSRISYLAAPVVPGSSASGAAPFAGRNPRSKGATPVEVRFMLSLEEIESGLLVTHKNTGLRYSVVEVGEDEVLLSPEQSDLQDLEVPLSLFRAEFTATDRYRVRSSGRSRSRGRRRTSAPVRVPSGPKCRGKIKKMVRDRGFGFIRGDDGKEVFFHRSGLNAADYDSLSEGDTVEYVVQEGPRGARAENVRQAVGSTAAAS